jgi:hypothetical protein
MIQDRQKLWPHDVFAQFVLPIASIHIGHASLSFGTTLVCDFFGGTVMAASFGPAALGPAIASSFAAAALVMIVKDELMT